MNFYEVKVEYTRQTGEDNPKAVKELYMTWEVIFGRAEQLVHDYLKQYAADLVTTQQWITNCEKEVIGNIHDNPELLKGK